MKLVFEIAAGWSIASVIAVAVYATFRGSRAVPRGLRGPWSISRDMRSTSAHSVRISRPLHPAGSSRAAGFRGAGPSRLADQPHDGPTS